jgi:hypothetical protein
VAADSTSSDSWMTPLLRANEWEMADEPKRDRPVEIGSGFRGVLLDRRDVIGQLGPSALGGQKRLVGQIVADDGAGPFEVILGVADGQERQEPQDHQRAENDGQADAAVDEGVANADLAIDHDPLVPVRIGAQVGPGMEGPVAQQMEGALVGVPVGSHDAVVRSG